MNRSAVLFIRTSVIYLALGLSLGTYILIDKALSIPSLAMQFVPMHIQWMLTGFLIHMIVGVAHWILPRLDTPDPRGSPWLFDAAYGILNLGNAIASVALLTQAVGWKWMGYALILVGVIIMAGQIWPRVYVLKDTKVFD